jgi:hypothetical protein
MIHIATVHYLTDRWIDLQLQRLAARLDRPYKLYSWLDGEAAAHADRFDEAIVPDERVGHWKKIDELAALICARAAPDDVLLFLDGDAFPVADLGGPLEQMLAEHPLAAIRRTENYGDPFPHPSFCATTPRFWQETGASWVGGHQVVNSRGESFTDTGANLHLLLEQQGIDWLPLSRTNARNLHPILFGVYDDLIYHHGAGFRRTLTRTDQIDIEEQAAAMTPAGEVTEELRERLTQERIERNRELSVQVYDAALADESFWRRLFY